MAPLGEQPVGGGDAGPACPGVRLQRVLVRHQPLRVLSDEGWPLRGALAGCARPRHTGANFS